MQLGGVGAVDASHGRVILEKRYRPEIEGLRAVAAFLVAVYHIWLMQVSGGVDVFFVVSGFLITTSLLSAHARQGVLKFGPFIKRLLRRLLPNALTVLLVVTIVSWLVLPAVRHHATISEVFASAFYYENWQLAITGTDYLDQTNEKSPVQHFWAMSIQGQFYVVTFVLVAVAVFAAVSLRRRLRVALPVVLLVAGACSFVFSVYLTAVDQTWAYFDTRTRLWEFMVGGLLALFLSRLVVPKAVSMVLGWLGLLVLVSTGLVLDVGASFPGYVALLPVGAAVLILVAGQNPSGAGVEKLLGSRPLVFLGGLSYGLYLWHWPLLSFYYVLAGTHEVPFLHGVGIIAAALVLSWASTTFVEKPLVAYSTRHGLGWRGFAPVIALLVAVCVVAASWSVALRVQSAPIAEPGDPNHPGALARTSGFPAPPELDPVPHLADVKGDKADPSVDGCHQRPGNAEVIICEYGETEDYLHTVALVGGSKSTHWHPALNSFAAEEQIRLLNVTKSGCRLWLGGSSADDCNEWNENVVREVADYGVDLVVTLADTDSSGIDEVPEGFLEQFRRFEERGVPILAIRDSPTFPHDVAECIAEHGVDSAACDGDRSQMLPVPSAWEKLEVHPANVTYVDYTEIFCDTDSCPVVIGNVIAYSDMTHMTATFSRSFAPILRPDVLAALGQ